MNPRRAALALVLACSPPDGDAASTDATANDGTLTAATSDDTGASTTGTLAPPDGYWLPLACGTLATVGQGNDTTYSHNGLAKYAFDIVLDRDTPVHAMADGTVLHIYAENQPGDPCHDGGDESCFPYANLVVLLHGDGTTSLYKHLDRVLVEPDAYVPRGGLLGLSGSTGWSNLPHLHVMRMEDCGATQCQSLPLEFVDAGVPITGEQVRAAACP